MDTKEYQKKIQYFNQAMPEYCPITYSMKVLSSKWKIPILWKLMIDDGQHYNHLKRQVQGITNTMLTKSLRELEDDGLVKRVNHGTVPPSVTYHLTDLGKGLIGMMDSLFTWGQELHHQHELREYAHE